MQFGSFYIGGRTVRISGRPVEPVRMTDLVTLPQDPNGDHRIEQAYVQWFKPPGGGPRIVFQHGGGLCGTIWEGTPDGRPGWAQLFLERGYEVYVIDNVERGRAGWCPFEEACPGQATARSGEEAWTLFRIGPADGYPDRRAFPGQRFPVAAFDDFLPFLVPRWARPTDLAVTRLTELVRRVGPCALVGHSQGGEIAWRTAAALPDLVRDLVLVEASGTVGRGIGPDLARTRHLFLLGDFLDRHPVFVDLATRTEGWRARLSGFGGDARILTVPGGSHMMMMDTNSREVAGHVAEWLSAG